MANVTSFSAFNLAATTGETLFICLKPTFPQKSFESVMACPFTFNIIAIFISDPAFPPTPVYTENGIEYKQCAPSNSPVRILSRTFAQDDSLVTTTSTPYFLNSPNSFAITIGEQSVSGINPNRTGSF
ncbi:hypothetical protein D3C86_551590 [compost metagenome]